MYEPALIQSTVETPFFDDGPYWGVVPYDSTIYGADDLNQNKNLEEYLRNPLVVELRTPEGQIYGYCTVSPFMFDRDHRYFIALSGIGKLADIHDSEMASVTNGLITTSPFTETIAVRDIYQRRTMFHWEGKAQEMTFKAIGFFNEEHVQRARLNHMDIM
jgi:hypothetical protein